MNFEIDKALIQKYNQAVPRYTSYPTVPFWRDLDNAFSWQDNFSKQFKICNSEEGISLYIHLPFCESLCTFCGCNRRITTNHEVEREYLQMLKKEWQLYLALMDKKPVLRELHIGGGTPTFFSPKNLESLLESIFNTSIIPAEHDYSFEGHPNNTTRQHLETLKQLGFTRVSLGVQDNNHEVQRIINRIQPFENVKRTCLEARSIGYTSINFDLIYGLPKQTPESIKSTIAETIALRPDRIAFYSYAHVPWTSRGQRLFNETDLPEAGEKLQLYMTGKKMLIEAGYTDIGMDHFALNGDDLCIAHKKGKLHRNFMGYTTQNTNFLLGIGVSSISDIGTAFGQNSKLLSDYFDILKLDLLPVVKGFLLNAEDQIFRKYILDISCKGFTTFNPGDMEVLRKFTFPELDLLSCDGLINYNEDGLEVTSKGFHFLRNICRAFDLHLLRQQLRSEKHMYSKAI